MKIIIDNFITGKEEVLEVDDKEVWSSGITSMRVFLRFISSKCIGLFKNLEYFDAYYGEKKKISNGLIGDGLYKISQGVYGELRLQVGRSNAVIAKITLTEVPNFSIAWKTSE